MSKSDRLATLQNKMKREIDGDLFFFPSRWGVDGYSGTGDVMFVGQKPSTGGFGGENDRRLYGSLIMFGLEDAHITDVSKEQGKAGEDITHAEWQRNLPYFQCEFEIVEPELLVTLGRDAESEVEQMDFVDVDTMYVRHYSRHITDEDTVEFLSGMKSVQQRARDLGLL